MRCDCMKNDRGARNAPHTPRILRTLRTALCALLSAVALVTSLSGCDLLLPSAGVTDGAVQIDGKTYTRVDRRSIVPAALGESVAKIDSEDGWIVLTRVEGDEAEQFLASSEHGVPTVWSVTELPASDALAELAVSYEVCYSDADEQTVFTCTEKDNVSALLAVLADGAPTALPADDGVTYYLKFSLEGYDGIRYVVGCFYDTETGESYIYDRDEKKPHSAAHLLDGQIPYSG